MNRTTTVHEIEQYAFGPHVTNHSGALQLRNNYEDQTGPWISAEEPIEPLASVPLA